MNILLLLSIGIIVIIIIVGVLLYFLFRNPCPKGEVYYGGECHPEIIPCEPACVPPLICEKEKCVSPCKPPCKEEEECVAKECLPICPPGTIREGKECIIPCSPPCKEEEVCREGECFPVRPCFPACLEGEVCVNGECLTKPCEPPCPEGKICKKGVCQVEVPCKVDVDCGIGYYCKEEVCTNSCLVNSDCPGSQICIGEKCILKHCLFNIECGKNEVCNEGLCLGDITCEKDCYGGLKCLDGVCKMCKTNQDCIPGGECKEGQCLGCVVKKCPSNQVCRNNYVCSTAPLPKLPNNSPCFANGDCESGKCSGFCFSGECGNNSLCPKGSYCLKNKEGEGVCQKEVEGSSCFGTASNCPLGYSCLNYICGKKLGTYGDSCPLGLEVNPCLPGFTCLPVERRPDYGGQCLPLP